MNITNQASDWFGQAAGDEAEPDISVGGLDVRCAALQRDERIPELAAVGKMIELRRRERGLPVVRAKVTVYHSPCGSSNCEQWLSAGSTLAGLRPRPGL